MALLIINSKTINYNFISLPSSHFAYEVPEENLSEAKDLFQEAWKRWFNGMNIYPTAKDLFFFFFRSHCISFKEIQGILKLVDCYSDGGAGLVLTSRRLINGRSEIVALMEAMGCANEHELASMIQAKGLVCKSFGEESGKGFSPFREEKEPIPGAEKMFVILLPPEENWLEILKNLLGHFLPNDFDWEAHVGFYAATLKTEPHK